MEAKDIIQDNNGEIRFKVGTQICGICKAKDNIIQFERNTKRKGLPIVEIAFICKPCAVKQGLIKDRLQAPTYSEFDFKEEQIKKWYMENGFKYVKRITRYTKGFNNLRKYLAPMYYHYNRPISRLFFGDGYIQMIGKR